MRAVVDPGVLVSALISQKASPYFVVRAWIAREFELVALPSLLRELETVLLRAEFRRHASIDEVTDYVDEIRRHATLVDDPEDVRLGLTPDPKDDYLVALARAADALLVSGDAHLIGLPGVMTPRDFLDALPS